MPNLEQLHACSNRIRGLGDAADVDPATTAEHLARALPQLRVLDLDNNMVDDFGQVLLLGKLPMLTRLQLNNNRIPDVQACTTQTGTFVLCTWQVVEHDQCCPRCVQ